MSRLSNPSGASTSVMRSPWLSYSSRKAREMGRAYRTCSNVGKRQNIIVREVLLELRHELVRDPSTLEDECVCVREHHPCALIE